MHALAMYFVHGTGSGIDLNPLHFWQKMRFCDMFGYSLGAEPVP